MRFILAAVLTLGACTNPHGNQHLEHAKPLHSDYPAVLVDTDVAAERAITTELAYQGATLALLKSKDRPCDFYEAQAYAALIYVRTADEDAKAAAQFGFNRAIKELIEYVQGTRTPPEGWC